MMCLLNHAVNGISILVLAGWKDASLRAGSDREL